MPARDRVPLRPAALAHAAARRRAGARSPVTSRGLLAVALVVLAAWAAGCGGETPPGVRAASPQQRTERLQAEHRTDTLAKRYESE
jgi:hypothetical protein